MSGNRERYLFVWNAVRGGKFFLLSAVIISLLAALGAYLILDRKYSSTGVILPSEDGIDNISMMQTGSEIGIHLADNLNFGNNITLYPAILKSRRIGRDILYDEYTFTERGTLVTRTLIEHIKADNIDIALLVLDRMTDFWVNEESGLLAISVRTGNPELSAVLVNAYINRLEKFNREERRSALREAYAFISAKLGETGRSLHRAEEELREFRSRNRNYLNATDPELIMHHRRLVREVELNQAIYEELNKQLEKTAIEVEKDTPILSILDRGYVPASHSAPSLHLMLLSFGLLGLSSSLIYLTGRAAYRKWRYGPQSRRIGILTDILLCNLLSPFSRLRPGRDRNGTKN